jgi:acetyl esterase/lipase
METRHLELKTEFGIDGQGSLDIFKNDSSKALILICPGGGYHHLSPRESLPVVNKFLSFGYNCALLKYSVSPYSYPTQLNEINASIKYLSKIYKNIFLMGFSAGGHLASLGGTDIYSSLVKGMILCYPVISLNEYTHLGTQTNFLGSINLEENRKKFSINNRVNKLTPPTFIWCTRTDESVSYQNTLMMIEALKKNNVYNEFIIYPNGPHGMALADESATIEGHENCKDEEVAGWVNNANLFIQKVLKDEK